MTSTGTIPAKAIIRKKSHQKSSKHKHHKSPKQQQLVWLELSRLMGDQRSELVEALEVASPLSLP
jgi:hypothetical protein